MLDFAIDIFRQLAEFAFRVLNELELKDGVSMWDLMITTIVCCGLVSVLIQRFGGSGISTEVTDTYNTVVSNQDEAARKSANAAREAERNSYSYYEKNRLRKEAYARQYDAKYHPKKK